MKLQKKQDLPYIILGAGGHAKVIIETLQLLKHQVAGIINPLVPEGHFFEPFPYIGSDAVIDNLAINEYYFVNALGSVKSTIPRTKLYQLYLQHQCIFPKTLHPQTIISKTAVIENGVQILAGAIVGPDACIKENVIINTRVIVEHDCFIDSHSHVASGATICGNVSIGKNVHIGAGATINQGIQIGSHSVIASGAVVTQNVDSNCLVAGVPAKVKFSNYFDR